jgi:hypothetical protein
MTNVITHLCKNFETQNVFTVATGQLFNSDGSTFLPESSYFVVKTWIDILDAAWTKQICKSYMIMVTL